VRAFVTGRAGNSHIPAGHGRGETRIKPGLAHA
jgi:hypothetical protein